MTKDKERDDALIAEKERLADILEKKAGNAYYAITSVDLRQAAALLRGDEQPKPDRAEVLVHELWIMDSGPSQSVWLEVVRRHFDELRAEWEAERPAVVVPDDVRAWALHWSDSKSKAGVLSRFILSLDGAKGGE